MVRLELPSYLEQSDAVRDRFTRLKARPVVLEVKRLTKTFESRGGPVTALKDIDLRVYQREFVCVIGASGCGKSTLIRILAGLETSSSGEMLLYGKAVHGPSLDRGMVFQGYTLFPWRTVKKNVMFGLEMAGRSRARAEEEARQWIDLVGLAKFENAYPHQLSGGMKQRVAIARALANQPRILLMDEPFGALDAQTRARMQAHLMEIWQNVDITILFITHDLDEAMRIGDRIAIMEDGAFVQVGTPEEILVNPRTEYVARFVEHADPTGVITAGTIARPLAGRHRAGGYPGLELELDEQGRLRGARHEGCKLRAGDLDTLVDEPPPATRHTDLLLQCGTHTSLRRVLRGRLHSALPVLVLDDSGRVGGLIDEPALIAAILDKRGPEAAAPASREVTHE
jgi:NitT/TauT family transport system ATP-binding protein